MGNVEQKKLYSLLGISLLVILMPLSLVVVNNVQAANSFHGIITSDTTWTKEGSPYTLDGPTAVNQDVNLIVEPGVTVYLNNFYLQVNGTLIARGTDNNKISFTGGTVQITALSQQTGQASVIENTVMDALTVSTSVTITKNTIKAIDAGGTSTVSHNTIESLRGYDSATITSNDIAQNCYISGSVKLTFNNIHGRVIVGTFSTPTISNNQIADGIHCDSNGAHVTINGNQIYSKNTYARIWVAGCDVDITNNVIIGNSHNKPYGISIGGIRSSSTIIGNQIYNCKTGISIDQSKVDVSSNVIAACDVGISLSLHAPITGASAPYNITPEVAIEKNTISQNTIGIQYMPYDLTSTITNNNIFDNTEYNFKLIQYTKDVPIINNWWGTTDQTAISQKIYDYKMDFNLGHITINPVLTTPIVDAPTVPNNIPSDATQPAVSPTDNPTTQPTNNPTTSPSQNPSSTQNQPNAGSEGVLNMVELAILVVLIIISVLLAVLIVTMRNKR